MNKPWKVIADLEADNSKLAKQAIVTREIKADNKEFFAGVRLAYDAMVTFGVKKVPVRKGQDGIGLTVPTFEILADRLSQRKATGHAALAEIDTAMRLATNEQWNGWYRRILIKDLRCGMSERTVNKMAKAMGKMKEYGVPVFEAQLAHDSKNHEGKVSGKKMIETKLDGVRVLTFVYPATGEVIQYSRNGKELHNFGHIKEQISKSIKQFKEPMVLDGEIMSATFQDLMTQINRKSNVNAKDAVLYLFDMVTVKEFTAGSSKVKQVDRTAALKKWHSHIFVQLAIGDNVRILEHDIVDLDTAAGQKKFTEINNKAIKGGYEGIMIKNLDAPYRCKRSVDWLKLKPFIEVSLKVIKVEEGKAGTKNVGKMGALLCEGVDDGVKIRVSVGSGYSDKQREEWFAPAAQKKLIGMVAEVRGDALSKSDGNDYHSIRFPRFKAFRGFKAGEKI